MKAYQNIKISKSMVMDKGDGMIRKNLAKANKLNRFFNPPAKAGGN
jgi:hypothetical protein